MSENLLKTFALNLQQTATNLIGFLRKPTDSPETDMPTKGKVRELFNIFLIKLLVAFTFLGLIQLIIKLGWYTNDGHALMGQQYKQTNKCENQPDTNRRV